MEWGNGEMYWKTSVKREREQNGRGGKFEGWRKVILIASCFLVAEKNERGRVGGTRVDGRLL